MEPYFGILVMFFLAGGVSFMFLVLAEKLGPKKPNLAKNTPYECGMQPFETPSGRHAVKFYLAGMLFVLFDIELVFLFPWAVVYRELHLAGFFSMMFFLFILELAFLYAWRKGILKWR